MQRDMADVQPASASKGIPVSESNVEQVRGQNTFRMKIVVALMIAMMIVNDVNFSDEIKFDPSFSSNEMNFSNSFDVRRSELTWKLLEQLHLRLCQNTT